jgi:hypothetical protein
MPECQLQNYYFFANLLAQTFVLRLAKPMPAVSSASWFIPGSRLPGQPIDLPRYKAAPLPTPGIRQSKRGHFACRHGWPDWLCAPLDV